MKTQPRTFSLEEANALLPEIEAVLCRISEKKESYERLHDHLLMQELICQSSKTSATDPQNDFTAEQILDADARTLDEAWASLQRDVEGILTLGCMIRSVERGWIDFRGRHEGKEVCFCWKKGERTIQYYHSVRGTETDRHLLS
jgi:hypothetical protein